LRAAQHRAGFEARRAAAIARKRRTSEAVSAPAAVDDQAAANSPRRTNARIDSPQRIRTRGGSRLRSGSTLLRARGRAAR